MLRKDKLQKLVATGFVDGKRARQPTLVNLGCVAASSCLPTPMTLASGGSPMFPLMVHLASSAVTQAGSVHKSRGDNVVRIWVQLKR